MNNSPPKKICCHVVLNSYALLSSMEHKRNHLEDCSGLSVLGTKPCKLQKASRSIFVPKTCVLYSLLKSDSIIALFGEQTKIVIHKTSLNQSFTHWTDMVLIQNIFC